ncbi:hypothetical protein [Magnetospirillum sp. SS-4]|nr:hypothetical protein [Magnetospirillum sp. SS-4]CAA7618398.1 conserved hypothetical protein [Magnetospirillum sp. SS-4]
MNILTRIGLFALIAMTPVLMDDIHDFLAEQGKPVVSASLQVAIFQGL